MPRLRPGAKPDPKGPPAADQLRPLSTNFDYLGGGFIRAERARQTLAVTVLIGVLALAALLFLGLKADAAARTDRATAAAATTTDARIRQQLGKLDRAGGTSADQLRSHDQTRQRALVGALGAEIDLARLLGQIQQSTPAGVELTAFAVTEPAAAGTSSTATPAPTPAAGSAPAGTTVTITANVASFTKVGEWVDILGRVPGMAAVTPTWSGGGTELVVTVTASLTADTHTTRSVAAATADQYGLAAHAPPGRISPTGRPTRPGFPQSGGPGGHH